MLEDVEFRNPQMVENVALEIGFLPFFSNGVAGFSIEEHTPRQLWFSDEEDGPWEWKGPIIIQGSCAYGKFFRGKAGFVSLQWLPDLINVRRASYKMRPLKDSKEKMVYKTIVENESRLTTELRNDCGFSSSTRKVKDGLLEKALKEANGVKTPRKQKSDSLDSILSRLQMSSYICIADFEYKYDKHGKRYGWGIARYTTPELMYGEEVLQCPRTAEESRERILSHLTSVFPDADKDCIARLLF